MTAKSKNDAIEHRFIDQTGKVAKVWGLSEPVGRVWGALMFSEDPLTQRQIAAKTGYGLSLVSPSLKMLGSLDMVRVLRGTGKERTYELTASFIETFQTMQQRMLERHIRPIISDLENVEGATKKRKIALLVKEYRTVEHSLGKFHNLLSKEV